MDILKEVVAIIRDVLDDEDFEVNMETGAKDHEDWDSLSQIQIIVESERKFSVKFTTNDVRVLKNVGDFVKVIEERIAAK